MPDTTPDPVAAALEVIRLDIALTLDHRVAILHAPRLLAAVTKALEMHQPKAPGIYECDGCGRLHPCPTRHFITCELLGEGARGGHA